MGGVTHRLLAIIAGVSATVVPPAAWAADQSGDEAQAYRIEPVTVPKEAFLEIGGLSFSPDGVLHIATRRGEIWDVVPGKAGSGATWRLFASGLHEPLGCLSPANGEVIVAQRPELTRLRDTDHDGRADRFDTLTAAWGVSGNYHEFSFGPVRDKHGNLYGTLNVAWEEGGVSKVPYRGWAYKLTPQGQFVPFAVGFRSPAGIGMSPDDELFVTDNQGDWISTSPLQHVVQGGFYGHPAGLKWEKGYAGPDNPAKLPIAELAKRRKAPAAWFVYGPAGHSPTEPIWDTTGGRFGPFAGQILVGDQTKSVIMRIALEKVGGEYQGSMMRFRGGFGSGITRMTFGPDGALWVGGTDRGWGAIGGRPYALERLIYTGHAPFEIHHASLTSDGFALSFTQPVDARVAADLSTWEVRHFGLRYWATYGSPHVSNTPVRPTAARVSADGKTVTLKLPSLTPERIYELNARGLASASGTPLVHPTAWYTLNRLRP